MVTADDRPTIDTTRAGAAQRMLDASRPGPTPSKRPPLAGMGLADVLAELDAGDDQARADALVIRHVAADALAAARGRR